jgi:hypothetical protein
MSELPQKDRVEFLLTVVADTDDREVLQRILEAVSANIPPSDDDVDLFEDLWDTFGQDLEDV